MCQVLPLSTFLFHLILMARQWHLHGPESTCLLGASLISPSSQPWAGPWTGFGGSCCEGDLRWEGWLEQRFNLAAGGQITQIRRPSPECCGPRAHRPPSQ